MVDHSVTLQGLGVSQTAAIDRAPLILKRTDADFIAAILAELESDRGISALQGRLNPAPGEALTLLQPVHRTFYLTVLEVACNPFDLSILQPRLDPAKIESSGLVVRRLAIDRQGNLIRNAAGEFEREGWRQNRSWDESQQTWKTQRNWQRLTSEDADPDSTRRPQLKTGQPELDRLLATQAAFAESVSPLFIAPPAASLATGRTILYGLIPVTSPERSEVPPQPIEPDSETRDAKVNAAIATMLPYYLRSTYLNSEERNHSISETAVQQRREPNANAVLTATHGDQLNNLKPNLKDAIGKFVNGKSLNVFVSSLQQFRSHFNGFDNPILMNELNQITIHAGTTNAQPFGDFLRRAAQVLLDREPNLQIILPETWVALSPQQHQKIVQLIRQTLMNQLATFTAGEGRFEEQGRQYQFRAFVRVKRGDGCPPQLVWSEYSPPFSIAPWYADSGLPPTKVVLPDILDPKALARLKPNVAFTVPPNLFNFLNRNNPKDLLEGKGEFDSGDGDENGIAWICAFNIPIITLCAYIVLNLFLQLFNLIFWWLFLVKICIPVPKKLFSKRS